MTAEQAQNSKAWHGNGLRPVRSPRPGQPELPPPWTDDMLDAWSSRTLRFLHDPGAGDGGSSDGGGILPAADAPTLHVLTKTLTELARFVGTLAQPGMGPRPGGCVCGAGTTAAPSDATADVFRREGDYWTLAWRGEVGRLRDMRGLHYIAQLLRDPGREFHALDLLNADGAGVLWASPRGGLELLDARAKVAYRQRLDDLRDELEEAERLADADRAARAQAERDAIAEQLAAAVGLDGRDRRAAAATERARCTVTQGIQRALKRANTVLPALADELRLRIKTGVFCVYVPDPPHPTQWVL